MLLLLLVSEIENWCAGRRPPVLTPFFRYTMNGSIKAGAGIDKSGQLYNVHSSEA
jgi:hypothetical protein